MLFLLIYITFIIYCNIDDDLFYDVAETFMNSSSINIANEFLNQELHENMNNNNDESEGSESKVQFFSSIIDKIIAKLEIVFLNIKVNIIFNIDKNKDLKLNNTNNENGNIDEDYQKCGFDLCIPHIKLIEGSVINENKDKAITNIMKDIIFNEFSINLNYYKNKSEQNETELDCNEKNIENSIYSSVLNKQGIFVYIYLLI